MNLRNFFFLSLFLTACASDEDLASANQNLIDLPGVYRQIYDPPLDEEANGWNFNYREELLTLAPDSTFTLDRIKPLGGFTKMPTIGVWEVDQGSLILYPEYIFVEYTSDEEGYKWIFDIGKDELRASNCTYFDAACKTPWIRD